MYYNSVHVLFKVDFATFADISNMIFPDLYDVLIIISVIIQGGYFYGVPFVSKC